MNGATNRWSGPLPAVQTKRQIQALLESAGLRPRKRFGQHFLIDGNLMRRLVESAEIDVRTNVLEVGGGTGGLTDLLAATARRAVIVELDRNLYAVLDRRFAQADNVTLVAGDVLKGKHEIAPEVARIITEESGEEPWMLVANLPYQVATPLVMNLLEAYPSVRRLCFTVQREVALRLTAGPRDRNYGPLAVLATLLTKTQVVARVPPAAFWPRPEVDSVIVRMDVREKAPLPREDLAAFSRFLRAVFGHRRKTLRNALHSVVDADVRDQVAEVVDVNQRPEMFAPEDWQNRIWPIVSNTVT